MFLKCLKIQKIKFNEKFSQFCAIICMVVADRKEKGGEMLEEIKMGYTWIHSTAYSCRNITISYVPDY